MNIEKKLREYVDKNYKPVIIGYKATDDGKIQYPEYDKSMWPTIVEYIEAETKKAKQALLNNLELCDNCYEDNRDFWKE